MDVGLEVLEGFLTLPGRLGWDWFAVLVRWAEVIQVGCCRVAWHGLRYDVVKWGLFLSSGHACRLLSPQSHRCTATPGRRYALA